MWVELPALHLPQIGAKLGLPHDAALLSCNNYKFWKWQTTHWQRIPKQSESNFKSLQSTHTHRICTCVCVCVEAAWASRLAARSQQQQQQQVRVIEICVQQFNELWHASAWATIELASFSCFPFFISFSFLLLLPLPCCLRWLINACMLVRIA